MNTAGPPTSEDTTSSSFYRFFLDLFSRFKISPVQITFAFAIVIGLVSGLGLDDRHRWFGRE